MATIPAPGNTIDPKRLHDQNTNELSTSTKESKDQTNETQTSPSRPIYISQKEREKRRDL